MDLFERGPNDDDGAAVLEAVVMAEPCYAWTTSPEGAALRRSLTASCVRRQMPRVCRDGRMGARGPNRGMWGQELGRLR